MTPSSLEAPWTEARARWPAIELSLDAYRAHVGRLQPTGSEGSTYLHDLFLAAACSAGDRRGTEIFDAEVIAAARGPVRRLDPNPSFVDEVLQHTRTTLLVASELRPPGIDSYAGRGPLAAWVTITAVRIGLKLLRQGEGGTQIPWEDALVLPDGTDPELQFLKRSYRDELTTAIRTACRSLDSRDRTIVQMHLVDGLGLAEIARVYAVHRATMTRWLAAARKELGDATRRYLHEHIDLSDAELDQMNRLVRSQLELSLSQLFAGEPAE